MHQRSLFQCFIRSPQLFPMSCNCFWPALKFEVKSRLGICTESGGFVASSTRIRLLLNPQLFIFGFKSFPVHVAYSNGIRLFTRNFGETLDTTISAKSRRRISEFENIRIHCPHVIGFVAVCGFFFVCMFFPHSEERIKKYPHSLPNSLDAYGQKPFPDYVWKGP